MSEIVEFVHHGASFVTPSVVEKVLRNLPLWKAEFAQINAPRYPHLVDQLEFLSEAVEDFAERAYSDLPYVAFAEAVFALTYCHRKMNVIPDFVQDFAKADASVVVLAVLSKHEKAFALYAARQNVNWTRITSQP